MIALNNRSLQRLRSIRNVPLSIGTTVDRLVTTTAAAAQPIHTPKYLPSPDTYKAPLKTHYRTIVVGGGHNGLVAAAYLAKSGESAGNVTSRL